MNLRLRKYQSRRGTVLFMVVGLLAMLFVVVSAYIVLARFDRNALTEAQRGEKNRRILMTVSDIAMSAVRQQWADSAGNMTPPDTNPPDASWGAKLTYEDRPGQLNGKFISSPEPVRDLTPPPVGQAPVYSGANYTEMDQYRYPGYSQFSSESGLPAPTLMRSFLNRQTTVAPYIDRDFTENARTLFMDADGDGVPDTYFPWMKPLNNAANAIAGVAVDSPAYRPFDPSGAPVPPITNAMVSSNWQRYDQQAHNDIAIRMLPHGGMIDLGAATFTDASGAAQASWAFQFVAGLFNGVKDSSDPAMGNATLAALQNLRQQAAAVEPSLRFRSGMLQPFEPPNQAGPANYSAIPEALRAFQGPGGFRRTMQNSYNYSGSSRTNNYQRFNFAAKAGFPAGDWPTFRLAAYLDPTLYNPLSPDPALLAKYSKRQFMTTMNMGDDNARVQKPVQPTVLGQPTAMSAGLVVGTQKFNLHDITDPTIGAFDPTLKFRYATAAPLIERAAGYFRDMIAGHDGFEGGSGTITEAVSPSEQAWMLAVNLIAAATPRLPYTAPLTHESGPGFIEMVVHTIPPTPPEVMPTRYVGYAPQPYITQVFAYSSPAAGGGGQVSTELGIELYNPNDFDPPAGNPAIDRQALFLPQFAISFNDDYEGSGNPLTWNPDQIFPLVNNTVGNAIADHIPTNLNGRSFMHIIVNSGHGGQIEVALNETPNAPLIKGGIVNTGTPIKVKLWRRGSFSHLRGEAGNQILWVMVDQMEIDAPDLSQQGNQGWQGAYSTGWRDTNTESYWLQPDTGGRLARWRCCVAAERSNGALYHHHENSDTALSPSLMATEGFHSLTVPGSGPGPDTGTRTGPTTPLYVMNGDIGAMNIRGASRPKSFPTVGFMLFLPRFAHKEAPNTIALDKRLMPMSRALYDQYMKDPSPSLATVPADFGHMPIFCNKQDAVGESGGTVRSYFHPTDPNRGGKIPWGLLAFDYFTTFNYNDPNGDGNTNDAVDPTHIPGRLNVNEAPWLLLANLPVIGPDANWDLPLHLSVSAALRSHTSNMLVNQAPSRADMGAINRFTPGLFKYDPTTGVWTLGAPLAVSAAGYRDRAQVLHTAPSSNPPALAPYVGSHARNSPIDRGSQPWMQYRNLIYGTMRGQATSATDPALDKTGFLSLGELVNVKGFDQSLFDPTTGAPINAVLNSGDFVKAVSPVALLDTHFLTTRSNTFTMYVTVADRLNPQSSVRSQVTIDRGNIVPKMITVTEPTGVKHRMTVTNNGLPEQVTERQVSYYNVKYDE